MDRDEWLRRFRARLLELNPSIAPDILAAIAGDEAYETLSPAYPDNPEKAVDEEAQRAPQHRL